MNNWVSLHTHTQYSLLDGASKIPSLVQRAGELGMPALGISDHGNLFGAYEFYRECVSHGIKPIIGMEAYVAPEGRHDKHPVFLGSPGQRKEDIGGGGAHTHMLVVARDAQGLRNLYALHQKSYSEGFYKKPRIDLDLLQHHREGLIATTGCAGGMIPTMLRLGLTDEANEYLRKLSDIFDDNLYLEVMDHGRPEDATLNDQLSYMSSISGVPLVATNDSHYTHSDEAHIHDALLCVQTRALLTDEKRFRFQGSGYHLRSYDEMRHLPLPNESLTNTLHLAATIESYEALFTPQKLMPQSSEHLSDVAWGKFAALGLGSQYRERLTYELQTIQDMGYEDYFLVLADICSWASNNGYMVGPGRGSACGSLVAFVLGITAVDPLAHGLLFERFLNPARVSVPDIDIDVQPEHRDAIIRYAAGKYGASRVAQIITYGTIKSRAALKDANRVLGGSYAHGEELVGMLPKMTRGRQAPLNEAADVMEADPEVFELALGLEGLVRSAGKHAAGVIISPKDLEEIIPIKQDRGHDINVTGFDQSSLEALGLVKFDLLGLDTLSIIENTVRLINENDTDMEGGASDTSS